MTLDRERFDNINWTRDFLWQLVKEPRVPKALRARALQLLKHYPESWWVAEQQKARQWQNKSSADK